MIWLAIPAVHTSVVAPDEFRRKVALRHMCVTEQATESGYKEVGLLRLERGDNLANVAVTKPANQPPMFEKGIVTAARSETGADTTRLIAYLNGERAGRPAKLTITLTMKKNDGMAVALDLSEEGKNLQFRCFPEVSGN